MKTSRDLTLNPNYAATHLFFSISIQLSKGFQSSAIITVIISRVIVD